MKVLYAFGLNEDGQCGNRKEQKDIYFPLPVAFSSYVVITKVSAGSRHSLALTDTGAVLSWGWGQVGQLGHGDTKSLSQPTRIEELHDIIEISAGGMHSGCIDNKNFCYTWGSSTYGQLGQGLKRSSSSFMTIPGKVFLSTKDEELEKPDEESLGDSLLVTKIACGGMHTAVVGMNGEVYCWGKADSGQTGYARWYLDFSPSICVPKRVGGLEGKAVDVSCGGFHTAILMENGTVCTMGKDDFGVLGHGAARHQRTGIGIEVPTVIAALANVTIRKLACGGWHSCFISEGGELFVCGKGEYGRLGVGDEMSKSEPTAVLVPGMANATDTVSGRSVCQVSAGGSHTVWFTTDNRVMTVGRVDCGRCAVGDSSSKSDPALARTVVANDITDSFYRTAGMKVLLVEAGGTHSFVLIDYPDFKLSEWQSFYGQENRVTPAQLEEMSRFYLISKT